MFELHASFEFYGENGQWAPPVRNRPLRSGSHQAGVYASV